MPMPNDPSKHEEYRKKMSHKGILNGNYGKPLSEERKRKIGEKAKKNFEDPEYRKRMSECHKGFYPSEESKRKTSLKLQNRIFSEEHRKKLSIAAKGKHKLPFSKEWRERLGNSRKGDKNPRWLGGVSFEPYCIKFNNEFKERVRAFFGYQCVECYHKQNGEKLHIHHVDFNKNSCCDPNIPKLFVPLCHSCHGKTNHKREYWEQHFTDMINQYYQGKCYLTKEEMEELKWEK
jgi:hypothetical protein